MLPFAFHPPFATTFASAMDSDFLKYQAENFSA